MNTKAQIAELGLTCLIAFLLFMAGMIAVNILKDSVTDARTGLLCSSPASISDGTKLTCLIVDGVVPYFIITIFSIAGGIIISKFII